jgi:hypothetical protein
MELKIPNKYKDIVRNIDYTVQALEDLLLYPNFPCARDVSRLNMLCEDLVSFTRTLYVLTQRINGQPQYLRCICNLQIVSKTFKTLVENIIETKFSVA